MQVDYLIIGQGLCGTWLSWFLQKENKSFLVIDKQDDNTPSRISAGVINPVTGRRMVKSWMSDELLPFAWKKYQELGTELQIEAIAIKNLIDFFPNPHQRLVFVERIEQGDEHLHSFPEQNEFNPYFNYELGCGEIRPCYTVNLQNILAGWRKKLKDNCCLLEAEFNPAQLTINNDSVEWSDQDGNLIQAQKIIFCDGMNATTHSYFEHLPFAPNKGECLLVETSGIPQNFIYKKGFLLVPVAEGLFWFGSNYQWKYAHAAPSQEFYEQASRHLSAWLKNGFRILEHKAGIRPATLERRPFVGMHPHIPAVGILNGMGTKGCSLAPYFASQLANHLVRNEVIQPDADIKRFSRILQK